MRKHTIMQSKEQYLNLYRECRSLIGRHSAPVMNVLRDEAHDELLRMGFPTRKDEEYKYTDVEAIFAPDYGINLGRLDIPVNPYDVFKCDVPNMSTSLYFIVNDRFYLKALPKVALPDLPIKCADFVRASDLVNNFDDGNWETAYEDWQPQADKLKYINICFAIHSLNAYHPYSIPDILRMNNFDITVTIKKAVTM